MKCLHEDKPCPYRKWVCKDGKCWWNCMWNCNYNEPMSECKLANEFWGCPFLCIYKALEPDSECPFKDELEKEFKLKLTSN